MKRISLFATVAMLLFFGCKEKDPVTPDRGRTLIHILGAIEADSFRVTLDYFNADDIVIDDFQQHRNFPIAGYADLEASGIPDEFGNGKLFVTLSKQPFANVAADTMMATRELQLPRDERATLCFVDSFGTNTFVKFSDELPEADAQFAQVRFINLSSSFATAGVTSTDNAINISGVGFLTKSAFTPVAAGFHDFELRDAGNNVVQTVSINVSPYTRYTFYSSGSSSVVLERFAH